MRKIIIFILIVLSMEHCFARTLTPQRTWSSSKTIEIGFSNLSETELLQNVNAAGMDTNAVRELLRTRKPITLTEVNASGEVTITTYKLTSDGKISCQIVTGDNNNIESSSSTEIEPKYTNTLSATNPFDISTAHTSNFNDFLNTNFANLPKYEPTPDVIQNTEIKTNIDDQGRTITTTKIVYSNVPTVQWPVDNWHKHFIGVPENRQKGGVLPNVYKQSIPHTTSTTTQRTFTKNVEPPVFDEWEEERRKASTDTELQATTRVAPRFIPHSTPRPTPHSTRRSTPRPTLRSTPRPTLHSAPHPTLLSKSPKPSVTTTPLPPLDEFLKTINRPTPKTYLINIDDLPITTPRATTTRRTVATVKDVSTTTENCIDAVLAKLNLTAADIFAQNGELVKNFIDNNGRILSLSLVLSDVKGDAKEKMENKKPLK